MPRQQVRGHVLIGPSGRDAGEDVGVNLVPHVREVVEGVEVDGVAAGWCRLAQIPVADHAHRHPRGR